MDRIQKFEIGDRVFVLKKTIGEDDLHYEITEGVVTGVNASAAFDYRNERKVNLKTRVSSGPEPEIIIDRTRTSVRYEINSQPGAVDQRMLHPTERLARQAFENMQARYSELTFFLRINRENYHIILK